MRKFFVVFSLIAISCRSTDDGSGVKGEVVFNANDGIKIESSTTFPNDPIVQIDLNNTKFSLSRINPADGVGDLTADDAFKLCGQLSYAGKSGWQMLSLREVSIIKTSSLSLVSGYSDNVHFFVSKKDRFKELDGIYSRWSALPNQQRQFSDMVVAQAEGYSDMNEMKQKRDALEAEIQNNKGSERDRFRTYNITTKTEEASTGVRGVICVRM